ncbi:MAG: aminotransferase class I/II-fold pyridoxal phosphate-dependent enzyme [Cytophagia bacterium]|nr:MAG: aminotransferase class I/II-fold pyridoxal phosphate-dependent enzyme [Runella sp.]TAG18720.1 MAG: aminotransferase class I/II-fold pyridoxal phosphate-dependent enzyme [Cytophagales bacterium]TAG38271.1 MAG: aminotransferase class I/II-fold pyridoxal phosphate-dependent enzyme [Cytophagia bacterium]TAG57978.1 MAG: aminotransferase class I/II-fold pyridoxal phosphate-dependent enzyme [Runella slithyformis]TAG79664.1 MAG: aminotransferase class I/II-fold pyridoxal phosphate-dependent enz
MIIKLAQRAGQAQEYYFSVKLAEVRKLQAAGHDVINMGIGNPDQMPSAATLAALSESVQQPTHHGYQPYKGIPALRQGIAAWYARTYGVTLDSETEILPLIGSKEGITHLSLTFVDAGNEVLVPELGYPAYRAVSQMVGAEIVAYPLLENAGWQPDWGALENLVSANTKLLWLNYPHMPTGAPATRSLFERAVAFAHKHRILLCHDNPYSLILNQKPPISLLSIDGAKEVAVELNSMSKSHNMAGWRVGWLAGAKPYIDAVLTIKSNVDSGMFLGIQHAAVAALQNSNDWHAAQNQVYAGRLEAAKAFLEAINCTYDTAQEGMFLWAKLPESVASAEALVEELLYQKHVFIAPGFIFGPKGQRYVRLSLCMSKERIWEAVARLNA